MSFVRLWILRKAAFFGQHIVSISEIDFFDGWLAVQPQSFRFYVSSGGFTKTDDEISDAAFSFEKQ